MLTLGEEQRPQTQEQLPIFIIKRVDGKTIDGISLLQTRSLLSAEELLFLLSVSLSRSTRASFSLFPAHEKETAHANDEAIIVIFTKP